MLCLFAAGFRHCQLSVSGQERAGFFRYLYYFLIAVQQILMIPIALIGLFDIWFDFRKFNSKKQATD